MLFLTSKYRTHNKNQFGLNFQISTETFTAYTRKGSNDFGTVWSICFYCVRPSLVVFWGLFRILFTLKNHVEIAILTDAITQFFYKHKRYASVLKMDRFCLPKMDKTNMFEASEFSTWFQYVSLKVKYSRGREETADGGSSSNSQKSKISIIFELCGNGKTNSSILHEWAHFSSSSSSLVSCWLNYLDYKHARVRVRVQEWVVEVNWLQ